MLIVIKLFQISAEPVKMIGGGKYNLNNIKEIKVTDSYLGLAQDVKGCQIREELEDCESRAYKETYLNQCGCIPFSIWISKNVHINNDLF